MVTIVTICLSLITSSVQSEAPQLANDSFAGLNPESLTPEKLQEFESQLNAEIGAMVDSMTPEQKKIFNQTVENLEKRDPEELQRFVMGEMNDSEMEDFLKSVLPEEALTEEAPVQEVPAVQVPKAEPLKPVLTSKHDKAIDLIRTIVKHSRSFMDKTTEIPELEQYMKQWKDSRKGLDCLSAVSVERAGNWSGFKADIEKMIQQLEKTLDKDPKKNTYKYLDDLINNESLYYNLGKLRDTLLKEEPKIETSSFGIKKINEACKLPVQNVINFFAEALDELRIPQSLAIIFSKYEPTAKELRETDIKVTDKALQESKQKPSAVTMKSVGSTPPSRYGSYDADSNYNAWPRSYAGNYSAPSYSSEPSAASSTPSTSASPFNGSGSKSGPKSSGLSHDKENGDKDASKEGLSGLPNAHENKDGKAPLDKRGRLNNDEPTSKKDAQKNDGLMEEVKHHLQEAYATKIKAATFTKDPVTPETLTNDLSELVHHLNQATEKIKEFDSSIAHHTSSSKAILKKNMRGAWTVFNGTTQEPRGNMQLKKSIEQLKKDIATGKEKIDQSHYEAYFFNTEVSPSTTPSTSAAPGSLSIDAIQRMRKVTINDVHTALTNLETALEQFVASPTTTSYIPKRR
jgi:hypothetical protein